jgi:uncharacterized Zn-binding protein involved in type VI secretion
MTAIATALSTVNLVGTMFPATLTLAGGSSVVTIGTVVGAHPAAPFGIGTHIGATVTTGSAIVKSNGIAVAREGDLCSCGHVIDIGTGDPLVQISG